MEELNNTNILYVGFYDYSYGCRAFILQDNKFISVQLTEEEYSAIHQEVDGWWDNEVTGDYHYIFDKYSISAIIVCEDGEYYDPILKSNPFALTSAKNA